ncbi:hypothetical protein SBRY_50726 [Actinacidiphila bryophytorum]|uniref:Uncharacterized protein n=1 Tax=Actinacidiphila bryophytorum TaxID=1436133 RepID=A0A9W4MIT1_9ACTN|nr:hypothetical protein SBRY_50726 [Actinacidiphila bryophytorum]
MSAPAKASKTDGNPVESVNHSEEHHAAVGHMEPFRFIDASVPLPTGRV